jgi:hypothetical protein
MCGMAFVADVSGIAYDALKMAVEHVLDKKRRVRSWLLRTSWSSTSAQS